MAPGPEYPAYNTPNWDDDLKAYLDYTIPEVANAAAADAANGIYPHIDEAATSATQAHADALTAAGAAVSAEAARVSSAASSTSAAASAFAAAQQVALAREAVDDANEAAAGFDRGTATLLPVGSEPTVSFSGEAPDRSIDLGIPAPEADDASMTAVADDENSAFRASLGTVLAVPLDDPDDPRGSAMIVHDAAAKLVTIRGAIRNQGGGTSTSDYWLPIIDANHQCDVGVASVVTGTSTVNINFTRDLGKRVSCAVTPDNDLISKGWTVGASFSSGMLQLTFKRAWTITDELTWNGSAWTWAQGGRFTIDSDSGGVLTVSHEALKGRGVTLTPRFGSGVTGERGRYLPMLSPDSGATSSSTSFKLAFYDTTTTEWAAVGTLASSASAGAASISSTGDISAGSLIRIDDTTNSEIVLTTGGTSGSGPYTVPVQALAKAHASGVTIYKQRVVPALVTARTANEANNLRVLVSRTWEGAVNPQTDINTTDLPLHNVWFEATAHLADDDAD